MFLDYINITIKDEIMHCNLINNPRMFNGATDDLSVKPYIPQKNYLNEFVANVLRDDIGIVIFGLRGHGGC